MKRAILSALALAAVSSLGLAQSNEERLQQKLSKDFFKNAAWVTDFDVAKQQAKDSGKVIFSYFTRSYAP